MIEHPVVLEFLLTFVEELLKLHVVLVISDVEAKGHRRVNLGEVNLLGVAFVIVEVAAFDLASVAWDGIFGMVWIQEDEALLLHAQQVVSLFRPASDDANIQLAPEVVHDRFEILGLDLIEPQSNRD